MDEGTQPVAGEEVVEDDSTPGTSLTRKAALGVGAVALGGAALGGLADVARAGMPPEGQAGAQSVEKATVDRETVPPGAAAVDEFSVPPRASATARPLSAC